MKTVFETKVYTSLIRSCLFEIVFDTNMGNSIYSELAIESSSVASKDPTLSVWLIVQAHIEDKPAAEKICDIFIGENVESVSDLLRVASGPDLEQLLSKIDSIGYRAKIREAIKSHAAKTSRSSNNRKTANRKELIADEDAEYKFEDKIEVDEGIVRIHKERPMIVGIFDSDIFSHSEVRIIYFSTNKKTISSDDKSHHTKNKTNSVCDEHDDDALLLVRVFCVDLRINKETGKNVLYVNGPFENPFKIYHRQCKSYLLLNTSIESIIKTAKETMKEHGDYSYFLNNCRHFSSALMKNIEKKYQALEIANSKGVNNNEQRINNDVVQTYIAEYFCDNQDNMALGSDEDLEEEKKMDDVDNDDEQPQAPRKHVHSQSKSRSSLAIMQRDVSDFLRIIEPFKPIGLLDVINEFDLINKRNILQSEMLDVWIGKNDIGWMRKYVVLKKSCTIQWYSDENMKLMDGFGEINIDIKYKPKNDDSNKNAFKMGKYAFRAYSTLTKEKWINAINDMIKEKEDYLKQHQVSRQSMRQSVYNSQSTA